MNHSQPIFSVSEFNEMINQHLSLLGEIVVEGEISEINKNSQPWVYMTIKDENSVLKLFGVSFQLPNLSVIEVGMKVKVKGIPGIYAKYGKFSLKISSITPSGEGALKLAYEKLKKQLENEGLFDETKKRKLPMFPQTIGLITAKGSQAYLDFIKVTAEMTGGLKIFFYPVNVQGDNAVDSVKEAIDFFNLKNQTDVLVITRGGGSLEDLAAFNDESIVRSIHSSKIPTICAIGHEGNVSLAELAADLHASTPSNAAGLLVRNSQDVVREIKAIVDKIETKIYQAVSNLETGISYFVGSIEKTILGQKIESRLNEIIDFQQRLVRNINISITRKAEKINYLKDRLKSLDHKSILKRGFSIVKSKSNKIIKSINQVNLNDKIDIVLLEGILETNVINKKKGTI